MIGRFAPSSTGPAHPGTLLAALLAWLDARSRGGRVVLRIEDLDPERCRPEFTRGLIADLAWLGLDWDGVEIQSQHRPRHDAALDRLAALGRLYPSSISRRDLEAIGRRAPDGGWAYDNRERSRTLPAGGWRACTEPLRVRLDDGVVAPNGWVAGVTRGVTRSTVADMGKAAAIGLGRGFVGEPALFEQGIEQQRLTIGMRDKPRARRQRGEGFESFQHRLRRFEAARGQLDQGRFHF